MANIDKAKETNILMIRVNNDFVKNYDGLFALHFIKDSINTPYTNVLFSANQSTNKKSFLQFNLYQSDVKTLDLGDYNINFYPVSGVTENFLNKTTVYKASTTVIDTTESNIVYSHDNEDVIYNGLNYNYTGNTNYNIIDLTESIVNTYINYFNNNINYISGVTELKLFISTFADFTGSTITSINGKVSKTIFDAYSGNTSILLNNKLYTSVFNNYTGYTKTVLNNKLDTAIFNTFTGSTSTNNNKLDKAVFNTYTGSTQTKINNKIDNSYMALIYAGLVM